MKDSSFLVRLGKDDHERLKLACAISGTNKSEIVRLLVDEWSSNILKEQGVYGFKRGEKYVTFMKIGGDNEVIELVFGDFSDAVTLKPIANQLTLNDLRNLANLMDCKLVRLD